MHCFQIGPVLRQYIVVIIADFTFFHLGLTIAWLSPLLIQLRNENQTVLPRSITEEEGAWLISISSLSGITDIENTTGIDYLYVTEHESMVFGIFVSFFFDSYLADKFGRKNTILLCYLPRLILCLIHLFAKNVSLMLFGRAINGISDIVTCSVTSTYASEIASKENRGGLGTIAQLMSALGSMLILSIGPFLGYKTLSIVITSATFVTFVPMLFIPESPYWIYAKGRVEESTKVLTTLRRKSAIQEELTEYSLNVNAKVNKIELFKDVVILKTFGKVIILALGSQLCGFNAVMFYLQTVFESTNTSIRPEISSVIIGCIQMLACLCTLMVTDRFGRKPVLITSSIGIAVGMIGLGLFFKLRDLNFEITGFLNYLPLLSIIVIILCFNAGMGATIWSVMAELFDGPSRVMGVSLGVAVAAAFAFLTTRYFGSITKAIGPAATYWMFSGFCIVTCLFVAFFVPETKGMAFSEIQRDMGRAAFAFDDVEINREKK